MASLKIIRKRIASVKSTQKITKAMKMVAAAKLRRAQDAATAARPYAEKLTDLLRNVAARVGAAAHPLVQVPTVERLLPIEPETAGQSDALDYLYEPNAALLLDRLVRQYVTVLIHRAFLEATASEHGARMTAMDSATSNASEMIDRLTL